MSLTPSTMVALGSPAGDFNLFDPVANMLLSRDQLAKKKGLLVIFMCNHCPFVKHIVVGLQALGRDYAASDIGLVAINSNDAANYPADSPENMVKLELGFPYLYDETQAVAKAYKAACTPDFFLFNGSLELVYRGQFDDSRPGSGAVVNGTDLRKALDALLQNKEISKQQIPSIGCNIKWK